MDKKGIPGSIIKTISNLNTECKTVLTIAGKTTDNLNVTTGIRQSNSVSPLLFNLMTDEIVICQPSARNYIQHNMFCGRQCCSYLRRRGAVSGTSTCI